jgi:hypothetical protein
MQAIIDADIQAGTGEGGGQEAEAARQRETGRLAVVGTKRQADKQPSRQLGRWADSDRKAGRWVSRSRQEDRVRQAGSSR